MASLIISKMDAVRAQLDAAIEIYFTSDNPIAVHSLTAAAYNILRDIARKEASEHPFLKTSFVNEYPEEQRKAIRDVLNHPENFLKHADRDADSNLNLNPEMTEMRLMDALAYFRDKDLRNPLYYDAAKVWLGVPKDGLTEEAKMLREAVMSMFKAKGKKQYWELFKQRLTARSGGDAPPAARA
jgi:hypothetical protein